MKVAVIGSGIAGNVAAYKLCANHDVSVFEKNSHVGGHTHTHAIELDGRHYEIDSGFIVFNDRTYPHFNTLLQELGIGAQKTEMSFSVKSDKTGIEYNGSNLNTLFAQRRNLARPSFHKLIFEILRFNRRAKQLLECAEDLTLNEFLAQERFSDFFAQHYLIPMGAAIWSTDPAKMRRFPAKFMLRFFENHGLLDLNNRPQWFVVPGGSNKYIAPLTARFQHCIRLDTPALTLRRAENAVYVTSPGQAEERFDAAFIATHSDQALALLSDPTPAEKEVLGAIQYQTNEVVMHTDRSVLPRRRKAWAAWNYHLQANSTIDDRPPPVALTYNMNILQGIDAPKQICVTLNNSAAIDRRTVIKRLSYEHPIFTPGSVQAQSRQADINGVENCYYCGAYWGNGFHEDGVVSALKAIEHFESQLKKTTATAVNG